MTAPRLEKVEQANIVELARRIGAYVVVLGVPRRGSRCPKCGEWVAGHRGTQQTPGVADLELFLPVRGGAKTRELLKWETKRERGRRSQDQEIYRLECASACVSYGCGTYNDFIAALVARGLVRVDQFPHYRQPKGANDATV